LYVVAYALIDISPIAGGLETLIAVLWALFIVMEITDVLDGMVARRQNIVTDLGKVLDPFADVVCRLTYFVILTVAGIVPLWFVMIVLYRELASVFLRLLFVREGIALGAGTAGKLKSWFYSVAAAAALFLFTADRLPGLPTRVGDALPAVRWAALAVYAIAAFLALWSIGGYIAYYARHRRGGSAGEPQNRGGSRA
jgi:CDP-diacylglycerol--glycerol-3-phosphate 3-phosphatidyltransferase